MARRATGQEHVAAARTLLRNAKTADELRTAQAVLHPLELGLSLEQTAAAIGRSRTAPCRIRTRYGKVASGQRPPPRSQHALRNHAKASWVQEAKGLDEVLREAGEGGVLVIPRRKPMIESRWGKPLALSTVYRLLARHGGRKLAPDTPPKATRHGARTGKKTPRYADRNASKLRLGATRAPDVPGRGALWPHQRLPSLRGQEAPTSARQGPAHAPIHLRLRGAIAGRWRARFPGAATRQHRVPASVHRCGSGPLSARKHRHGDRRCRRAQEQGTDAPRESSLPVAGHPIRPNSTRRNRSGRSYVNSSSTTASSIRSRRWKITS